MTAVRVRIRYSRSSPTYRTSNGRSKLVISGATRLLSKRSRRTDRRTYASLVAWSVVRPFCYSALYGSVKNIADFSEIPVQDLERNGALYFISQQFSALLKPSAFAARQCWRMTDVIRTSRQIASGVDTHLVPRSTGTGTRRHLTARPACQSYWLARSG